MVDNTEVENPYVILSEMGAEWPSNMTTVKRISAVTLN